MCGHNSQNILFCVPQKKEIQVLTWVSMICDRIWFFFINSPWPFKCDEAVNFICDKGAKRELYFRAYLSEPEIQILRADLFWNLWQLEVWPGWDVAAIYKYDRTKCLLVLEVGWFSRLSCVTCLPKTAAPDSKLTLMQHPFLVTGSITNLFARVRLRFYSMCTRFYCV